MITNPRRFACAAAALLTISAASTFAMDMEGQAGAEAMTYCPTSGYDQGMTADQQGMYQGSADGSGAMYGGEQGMYGTGQGMASQGRDEMSMAASIWNSVWGVIRNIGQAIAGAFSGQGGGTERNARAAATVLGAAADAAQNSPNPFESVGDQPMDDIEYDQAMNSETAGQAVASGDEPDDEETDAERDGGVALGGDVLGGEDDAADADSAEGFQAAGD